MKQKKIPMELEALTVTTRSHLDDIVKYYVDKSTINDIDKMIDTTLLVYLKCRFIEILDRLDNTEAI